jgi:hypothetical protein
MILLILSLILSTVVEWVIILKTYINNYEEKHLRQKRKFIKAFVHPEILKRLQMEITKFK